MKKSLVEDYIAGAEELSEVFPWHYDEWEKVIKSRKRQLASPWTQAEIAPLRGYNQRLGASEQTLKKIESLTERETLVIATGQQPGLLGGPLYNLYKALTAIKLSKLLSTRFGLSVVPIFWLGSDDHDLEEVGHFFWLNQQGRIEEFTYRPKDHVPGTPLFATAIDEQQFSELFQRVQASTLRTEFRDGILSSLHRIISQSASFEEHSAGILCWLLGEDGIVLVPPHLPPIRQRAVPLITQEIESAGQSSILARQAAKELQRLGYKPQVHRQVSQVNFFLLDEAGRRCRIDFAKGRFELTPAARREAVEENSEAKGQTTKTLRKEELLELIKMRPERTSFNVMSRPLVQDFTFSTIASVAGPGEISYFAQYRRVYEHFAVFMPLIFPRAHLLIVEPRLAKLLKKYQLPAEGTFNSTADELRAKIVEGVTKLPLSTGIEHVQAEIQGLLNRLAEELAPLKDVALRDSLEKLRQHLGTGFSHLVERYQRAILQKDSLLQAHQEEILSALVPRGEPQERVFTPFFPFLLNHGEEFLHLIRVDLDPFVFRKVVYPAARPVISS